MLLLLLLLLWLWLERKGAYDESGAGCRQANEKRKTKERKNERTKERKNERTKNENENEKRKRCVSSLSVMMLLLGPRHSHDEQQVQHELPLEQVANAPVVARAERVGGERREPQPEPHDHRHPRHL